jgi:hypothetical protein
MKAARKLSPMARMFTFESSDRNHERQRSLKSLRRYECRILHIKRLLNPQRVHKQSANNMNNRIDFQQGHWESRDFALNSLSAYPEDLNTCKTFGQDIGFALVLDGVVGGANEVAMACEKEDSAGSEGDASEFVVEMADVQHEAAHYDKLRVCHVEGCVRLQGL